MLEALSWSATALSLVGNILIARQSRIGFVVWIVTNILWIVVNVIGVPNMAQIVLFSAYTLTCIYGLVNWKRSTTRPVATVDNL